jgi:hypothetical protein
MKVKLQQLWMKIVMRVDMNERKTSPHTALRIQILHEMMDFVISPQNI